MQRDPIGYAKACLQYVYLPKLRAALRWRRSVAYHLAAAVDLEGKVVGPGGVLVEGRTEPIRNAVLIAWLRGDHATVRRILSASVTSYGGSLDEGIDALLSTTWVDSLRRRGLVYRDDGAEGLGLQEIRRVATRDFCALAAQSHDGP